MSSPLLSEHIDEILSQVYQAHEECSLTAAISASWTRLPPHRLAILLLIFALGALMDLKLPVDAFLFEKTISYLGLRSRSMNKHLRFFVTRRQHYRCDQFSVVQL